MILIYSITLHSIGIGVYSESRRGGTYSQQHTNFRQNYWKWHA